MAALPRASPHQVPPELGRRPTASREYFSCRLIPRQIFRPGEALSIPPGAQVRVHESSAASHSRRPHKIRRKTEDFWHLNFKFGNADLAAATISAERSTPVTRASDSAIRVVKWLFHSRGPGCVRLRTDQAPKPQRSHISRRNHISRHTGLYSNPRPLLAPYRSRLVLMRFRSRPRKLWTLTVNS